MHKSFLLTYDAISAKSLSGPLQAFIASNRHVDQWSLLYPGAYFLKSHAEFRPLVRSFTEFFGNKSFVLAEIGQFNNKTDGVLQPEIWTWLNQNLATGSVDLTKLLEQQ